MIHLKVGELYDIGTSLGSYLLALGAAEPVDDDAPARIVPLTDGAAARRKAVEQRRSARHRR